MQQHDQDHEQQRYQQLAEKWQNGSLTPEEEKEFDDWYSRSQDAPVSVPAGFAADEQALRSRMWHRISDRTQPGQRSRLRSIAVKLAAAASIAAIAVTLFIYRRPAPLPAAPPLVQVKRPAEPARHATLTLSDGSQVKLDEAGEGTITQQGNTRIVKLANGQLAYQFSAGDGSKVSTGFNTITTPRGEQYQLLLPDRTRVWLNAASSLRFPTAFTGNQRAVELSGEAYFEVTKNASMPFVVQTGSLHVQVLGTHFNVMAYKEEDGISTTLLEGSVRLQQGDQQTLLKPGQQGNFTHGALQVLKNVNLEEVMAWKNGEFYFHDMRLDAVMRQIQRWYDVTVEYKDAVSDISLSGSISHTLHVEELFEILEATHQVQFTQRGNTVVVSRVPHQ